MNNVNLLFTLDYEIHGNGDGDPNKLMVEPTYKLMNLLEKYEMKLTIMADVAEILCFKRYYEQNKIDRFSYLKIEHQLKEAIRRGHDVQLHIHSSYIRAEFDGKRWNQYIDEYNLASLSFERINEIVRICKNYLEDLLKPIDLEYKCILFRAANWSMMPTKNIYKSLIINKINYDSSVFKGGVQGGNVSFDYRKACSHYDAYPASENNINNYDEHGKLTELPIYTEMKYFWSFISLMRIFRMIRAKFHKHKKNKILTEISKSANENSNRKLSLKSFFVKSPWKLDFNQASSYQMKRTLNNILKLINDNELNIVLIGHSKTFINYNQKSLEIFLKYAKNIKGVNSHLFRG